MNWLYNHYFGEGPGIPKDAPKPKGLRLLAVTLSREWWGLIKLNVLFIAASLPLFTLPAAYAATNTVGLAMLEDRNVWLWRDFWTAFKTHFRASTIAGAALLFSLVLTGFAIRSYADAVADQIVFVFPLVVAICVLVLLQLFGMHLFAALAHRPDASLPETAKAAALGLLARPLPGLAALGVIGMLWLAHIVFYPASVLLPVLVNFSLGALVTCFAVHGGVQFGFSHIHTGTKKPVGEPDMQSF